MSPNLKQQFIIKLTKKAKKKKKKRNDNLQRPRHKILIIEDSHARGMAGKLQHNPKEDYSVQGLVKAGAELPMLAEMRQEKA
jgi:hypothetical protein